MEKEKLKTLKDFEEFHNYDFDFKMINKEELKSEAVKWVKSIMKECSERYLKSDGIVCEFGDICINCEVKINWIKHFFNLTEEDLK
jgi:hypothetical protein